MEGIAGQISSLMQFNRLHRIVATRACEYLFFLRHIFNLVRKDFVLAAFPKKFFNNEQLENALALATAATHQ